jgi:hypothetical protein
VVLLVLVVLGAAGYAGWRWWDSRGGTATVATRPCVEQPKLVVPPPMKQFDVRNGTLRAGLAHRVASALRRQHLPVRKIGNTPRQIRGSSRVVFPPSRSRDARIVAARVFPPAVLVPSPAARVVELDLGGAYRRPATPREFRIELVRLIARESPTPTPRPTACSSASPSQSS